jgi:hypothetical protein
VTHFEFSGRSHELPAHMRASRSVLLFEVFEIVADRMREVQALMVNLPCLTRSGWQ